MSWWDEKLYGQLEKKPGGNSKMVFCLKIALNYCSFEEIRDITGTWLPIDNMYLYFFPL